MRTLRSDWPTRMVAVTVPTRPVPFLLLGLGAPLPWVVAAGFGAAALGLPAAAIEVFGDAFKLFKGAK